MDLDSDILTDAGGPTIVSSPIKEESVAEGVAALESDSDTMMEMLLGLRVAVQELYASEDIEVRLCWWLIWCLVGLWFCIILAWKTYGREIMAVLTCQDKLTRSGSMSRESSRQSSAEEVPVVTEPPATRSETWQDSGRPIESSVSEPHHSKAD